MMMMMMIRTVILCQKKPETTPRADSPLKPLVLHTGMFGPIL